MSEVCSICGGSGLRVVQENGRQFAQDCVCRVERRAQRMLGRARIPRHSRCAYRIPAALSPAPIRHAE